MEKIAKILLLCQKKYIILITTKLIDLLGTLFGYSQSFGYIICGRLLIGGRQLELQLNIVDSIDVIPNKLLFHITMV